MQINVEEVDYCKLNVHVESSNSEISSKKEEVLQLFKSAPIPGFRKGKASIQAIKIYYKDQINDALKKALAEQAFHETLFEKEIKPLGNPTFTNMVLSNDVFSCDFMMQKKPDFQLSENIKKITIPKPATKISISDLNQKILQDLRVRFGEQVPFSEEDFVQTGDQVIVNYEGKVNGEVVEALCANGEMFTVGSSEIPEIDTNILGMKVTESRSFDMKAPESAVPSLSGKRISLTITLLMGSKIVLAPLDDSLAEKAGKKSIEELQQHISAVATARLNSELKSKINEQISEHLVAMHDFKVPNWLALSEARYLTQASKLDFDSLKDEDKEKFVSLAERNVKLSLILDRIRETEPEAQLSDQEVYDILKNSLSRTNPDGASGLLMEFAKSGYLKVLFARIRDEHTLDVINKSTTIVE